MSTPSRRPAENGLIRESPREKKVNKTLIGEPAVRKIFHLVSGIIVSPAPFTVITVNHPIYIEATWVI